MIDAKYNQQHFQNRKNYSWSLLVFLGNIGFYLERIQVEPTGTESTKAKNQVMYEFKYILQVDIEI